MIVEHIYKNFQFKFQNNILSIICTLDGQRLTREYTIGSTESISINGEYVYFQLWNGKQIQLKFEGDSGIVLDLFDVESGDFVDTFGCYDFADDLDMDDDEDFNEDSLVTQLMKIRANWNWNDFKDAYGDEWEEMPATLEGCFELMEEYIHNTYAEDYLLEVIADEKV